jgi:hypothetical protein
MSYRKESRMKQIRLDNTREVTITDEAYANVLAAIEMEKCVVIAESVT